MEEFVQCSVRILNNSLLLVSEICSHSFVVCTFTRASAHENTDVLLMK